MVGSIYKWWQVVGQTAECSTEVVTTSDIQYMLVKIKSSHSTNIAYLRSTSDNRPAWKNLAKKLLAASALKRYCWCTTSGAELAPPWPPPLSPSKKCPRTSTTLATRHAQRIPNFFQLWHSLHLNLGHRNEKPRKLINAPTAAGSIYSSETKPTTPPPHSQTLPRLSAVSWLFHNHLWNPRLIYPGFQKKWQSDNRRISHQLSICRLWLVEHIERVQNSLVVLLQSATDAFAVQSIAQALGNFRPLAFATHCIIPTFLLDCLSPHSTDHVKLHLLFAITTCSVDWFSNLFIHANTTAKDAKHILQFLERNIFYVQFISQKMLKTCLVMQG